MNFALAQLPFVRLTRSSRAFLPIAGWIALGLFVAWVERTHGSPHAAGHALLGTFGQIILPLLVLGIVAACLAGRGMKDAAHPLVLFGAPPARAKLALVVTAMSVSAVLSGALAGAVVFVSGGGSPGDAVDALTSAWVSALGAASYAAFFSMGASFGARGGGRTALLVLDWILGSGAGVGALVTPRGHLRNLLGGVPPAEISQQTSAVILVLILATCTFVATRRT